MATSSSKTSLDLAVYGERIASQFRGLNWREPGQWPLLPRASAWLACVVGVIAVAWMLIIQGTSDDLDSARGKEPKLKEELRAKLNQAANLSALKRQKSQVQEYVTQLERQLPGKAEMDALLSDINQAGLGRGLQIEVFKPGKIEVKDYYAELPITIRVVGHYHDIGSFAADIANLSRIVTLNNLSIVANGKDPNAPLIMDAVARTYRYLDQGEVSDMQKAKSAKQGEKK